MRLDDWRAAGTFRDSPYGPIFTRTEGSGPALLFIHGFPTASWDWSAVWPAFTPCFRCRTRHGRLGFACHAAQPTDRVAGHFSSTSCTRVSAVRMHAHDYGDTVARNCWPGKAATGRG
jgi:hypothetical protein